MKRAEALKVLGVIAIILYPALAVSPGEIAVMAGKIYGISFKPESFRWFGVFGKATSGIIHTVFHAMYRINADVSEAGGKILGFSVPDYNPEEDLPIEAHWIFVAPENVTINTTKFANITEADLKAHGVFNESIFHVFYPGYATIHDAPNKTFTVKGILRLFGKVYEVMNAVLADGRNVSVIGYMKATGEEIPIIVADPKTTTCFNGSICTFELLLPTRIEGTDPEKYLYLYVVPKYVYNITVYVDGVESTEIPHVGLPYVVTVKVTDKTSGLPVEGVTVAVEELFGQNPPVPYAPSAILMRHLAYGQTNSSGMISFVVTPTAYGASEKYLLRISILSSASLKKIKSVNMTIADAGNLYYMKKKPFTGSELNDMKATVNSLMSVVDAQFRWANQQRQARRWDVVVYTNGSYFPELPVPAKTGAFTIVRITLKTPDGYIIDGNVTIEEYDGLLILNPEYDTSPLGFKRKYAQVIAKTGQDFIISPTHYPPATSTTWKLSVYYGDTEVAEIPVTVDGDLNIDPSWGSYYEPSNELKEYINRMQSILSYVFYAIN